MLHFLRPAGPLTLLLFVAVVLPGAASAASTPTPPPGASGRVPPAVAEPDERLAERVGRAPQLPLRSVFEDAQVVSFYGYPGIPGMGALGAHPPERAADEVLRVAGTYDALNGERGVVPALHLIVAVAQTAPMEDGSYLDRLSEEEIGVYVEVARERGLLLFLDVQVGWSDPLMEVRRLSVALAERFVHLALDPEFATRASGRAPGIVIGSIDAAEINAVQDYLAALVRDRRLPPKLLVLHQFTEGMLPGAEQYAALPEVEITIDMDGYGTEWGKLANYEAFALAPYAERPAIKLFYDWDTPLLPPERLLALERPPDLVIYQ